MIVEDGVDDVVLILDVVEVTRAVVARRVDVDETMVAVESAVVLGPPAPAREPDRASVVVRSEMVEDEVTGPAGTVLEPDSLAAGTLVPSFSAITSGFRSGQNGRPARFMATRTPTTTTVGIDAIVARNHRRSASSPSRRPNS